MKDQSGGLMSPAISCPAYQRPLLYVTGHGYEKEESIGAGYIGEESAISTGGLSTFEPIQLSILF